ncbi:MAG: serine/threonine-protein kinase [Gemmataceae bacterium]
MSLIEWLWQAEALLKADPDLDLCAAMPGAGAGTVDELAELAVLQLSRGVWSGERARTVVARFQAYGLSPDRLPDVVRLAYRNRLADRTAGSWSDVETLGVQPDELRLNHEGECGWLGQTLLGRFRLESRLGRGALAVVYRARDEVTGEQVAVKLPASESLAVVVGPIFRSEADATRHAEHSRVPRVLGCYEAQPVPVLVMQLIVGRTLAEWQSGRPVQPEVARGLILQVLEPLANAHARGVIHRDPSPTNILIDSLNQVWLTDWNASLREDELTARDGDYSGTPGYASQEGLYGLTSRIDPRSDLWSVGAVLYELLTGRRLAAVSGREEAIVHSAAFDPAELKFPGQVPEWMQQVCRKALQPNAALRYGSAAEFRRELADGRVPEQKIRWTNVFEMGHKLGQVRRGWLFFTQHLRHAAQTEDSGRRVKHAQLGVAQMILADQALLEMTELAASVGVTVACAPIPAWLPEVIYTPRSITPDWYARANQFAADSDARQTLARQVTESQFASDEMRAVFRLGFLIATLPPPMLRAELHQSPLLAGFPTAVREKLVGMLDDLTATARTPAEADALFPRRVRDWIDSSTA